MNEIMEQGDDAYTELCGRMRESANIDFRDPEGIIRKFAALKMAIRFFADLHRCSCAAIQCWPALPVLMPEMQPCYVNSLLSEMDSRSPVKRISAAPFRRFFCRRRQGIRCRISWRTSQTATRMTIIQNFFGTAGPSRSLSRDIRKSTWCTEAG